MKLTPLHAAHIALNAKMGAFAGYDMPLYYALGVMKEHEWVRGPSGTEGAAGIFDVSHMGQVVLEGDGAIAFLEKITPSGFSKLAPYKAKYTVMTNAQGGVVDDLIVTKITDTKFFIVINAGCKDKDLAWMQSHLPANATMKTLDDRALIALQGPKAEAVLRDVLKIDASAQGYMSYAEHGQYIVSRLGYTGEDGFEISIPEADATQIWQALVAHEAVKPIGLAARDSLRLEMGYCLYGHELDDQTTPLEADLEWVMSPANKSYIGADKISAPKRRRVGFRLLDKGIAREGADITKDGKVIGKVSSGGWSPTLNAAIGMAYVETAYANTGEKLDVVVRNQPIAAEISALPFVTPKTRSPKKQAA